MSNPSFCPRPMFHLMVSMLTTFERKAPSILKSQPSA
jgi:hypothetical protein